MSLGGLIDRYGRTAVDLRVSLTDKCNLRCTYCMPAEGLEWLPKADVLTDDEVVRLLRVAVERLGIEEVRFTGGEPLLRKGLVDIIGATAALRPRPNISLTTNGIGLTRLARPLVAAGLDRINVDEASRLLNFALDNGYELRFIEQMPLDAGHVWNRHTMVTAEEILAQLEAEFTLLPDPAHRGAAPAETWLVSGYAGAKVGIIASVTRPFCGDCDRTRLTADGQVRNCLFGRDESDLRGAMRAGASDDKIADMWRTAMFGKLPGHAIDDPSFLQPSRPMSAIGG